MVFEKTDILLPKIKDYRKWAVVACDQFTSQPEYWENVQKYVGDEVSTYNLILPEAQLSENNDDKIASINETMNSYLKILVRDLLPNSVHTVHICPDIITASAGGRIVIGHPPAYIDQNEPDLVSVFCGPVWKRYSHLRRNDL